jgi:hypothetical protein
MPWPRCDAPLTRCLEPAFLPPGVAAATALLLVWMQGQQPGSALSLTLLIGLPAASGLLAGLARRWHARPITKPRTWR